jgi:hypothetical protein
MMLIKFHWNSIAINFVIYIKCQCSKRPSQFVKNGNMVIAIWLLSEHQVF